MCEEERRQKKKKKIHCDECMTEKRRDLRLLDYLNHEKKKEKEDG